MDSKIIFFLLTFSTIFLPHCNAQENLPTRLGRSISVDDKKIECEFEGNFAAFDGVTELFYACNLKTPIGYSLINVIEANEPTDGKTLIDVNLFLIDGLEAALFPRGLSTVFPSISAIQIKNSGLRQITASDLAPFANLKYLSLTENLLQFLPENLLASNLNLEFFDIQSNMIVFVDGKVFENLANLRILRVGGLTCYLEGKNAETAADVANLVDLIKSKCSQTPLLVALYANYIVDFVSERKIAESQAAEIENYLSSVELLNNDIAECRKTSFEDVYLTTKKELEAKVLEASDLSSKLSTCDAEKKTLEAKVEELEEQVTPSTGTCKFKDDPVDGYTCIANKISIKSAADQKISWTGTHSASKQNSDVKTLSIKSQATQLLPLDVGKTFANLQTLIVDASGLQKLMKNDFKTLEGLNKLSINWNEISSIESGTFDVLTKLNHLELSKNKILALPSRAFAKLEALSILNLSGNLLTELKSDLLSVTNEITKFYGNDNNLSGMDIYFVWRLKNCNEIDLTGNKRCDLKFDGSKSFQEFFSSILGQC